MQGMRAALPKETMKIKIRDGAILTVDMTRNDVIPLIVVSAGVEACDLVLGDLGCQSPSL